MSFFRKKRPQTLSHTQPSVNGTSSTLGTPTSPSVVQLPSILPEVHHSPLEGFVPPEEDEYLSIAKCKARDTSSIDKVLTWAKEYFVFFLRGEELDDIIDLYEQAKVLKKKYSDEIENAGEDSLEDVGIQSMIQQLKYLNIDKISETCEQNDASPLEWITSVYDELHNTLQEQLLPRFLESKFYIKCQVDFFTNNDIVTLRDLLSNNTCLFYFMEYVDQENKREVLEFLMGATNFAEQFHESITGGRAGTFIDAKIAQKDAMVLYEKYISLQAPHFLGFRDEIRSDVERLICSQNEIAHCFERASDEACVFLHVTCFEGFLKSSLFLAFLSDLINSLSPPQRMHKRSGSTSTCSSNSVSLTSPTTHSVGLLQAPRSTLSLGRVNAIGKFEADTDLEFLKQQESGLTKTVKKLVNFDEKEKAKEELAWQVAAMIVNEVTSITMGTGDGNSFLQQ